jgi:hypothetical protein
MNWIRIWTGAAIAAAVLWFFDIGNLILTQRVLVPEPNLMWGEVSSIAASLIVPSLVTGFLLSWLYALTRPRLGPGPLTALVMGSIGFAFANPHFFGLTIWMASPTGALIQMALLWLKFAAATYLAGWQYIEKAP